LALERASSLLSGDSDPSDGRAAKREKKLRVEKIALIRSPLEHQMAPDELERLNQEIESLRADVRRLQQRADKSDNGSARPDDSAQPEDAGRESRWAEELDELEQEPRRLRSFIREHPYYAAVILVVACAVAGGVYAFWGYLNSYEGSSDAHIVGDISPISSQVPGTVIKVLVHNDEAVKVGQPLVQLDTREYQLLVDRARAMRDGARAAADASRSQYKAAQAKMTAAYGHLTGHTLEAAQNMATAARQAMDAKFAAEHAADAAVQQAELKLRSATVTAPVDGIVAERTVNVGERVEPSQRLLAIVQTGNLKVSANFKETQLRKIHRGKLVTIHVDALARDFRGTVEGIAPATKSQFTLLPSENASGNYVKVVQRVTVTIAFNGGQDLSRLIPGMSVEPKVWVDGH
jgi:membrane fusion protein (multidrug efflux system)